MRIKTTCLFIASALVVFGDSLEPEFVHRLNRINETDHSYLTATFTPKRYEASAELHEHSRNAKVAYFGTIERPYHDSLGPLTSSHALFMRLGPRNIQFGFRPRIDLTLDYFEGSESGEGVRIGDDGIRNYYWKREHDQWRRHTALRYSGLLFGRHASTNLEVNTFLEASLGHHFGYTIDRWRMFHSNSNKITYQVNDYEPEDFSTSLLVGCAGEGRLRVGERDLFIFLGGMISSEESVMPPTALSSQNTNNWNDNEFGVTYERLRHYGRRRILWAGLRAPPAPWGEKNILLWCKNAIGLSLQECGIRLLRTKLEKEVYELQYPPHNWKSTRDSISSAIEASGMLFRIVPEIHFTSFVSLSIPFSFTKESRTIHSENNRYDRNTYDPEYNRSTDTGFARRVIALRGRAGIPVHRFFEIELTVFSGSLVLDDQNRYPVPEPAPRETHFYRFSDAYFSVSLVSSR